MWLIDVETRRLAEFVGLDVPPYAILSHTWIRGQEVAFQEMRSPAGLDPTALSKSGWEKIGRTCHQAARDGLKYAWVDTCCIDKSSSAELSEAINSMFRWYKRASICYVFLSDLAHFDQPKNAGELQASIKHCRWFTRSWTLQELIAPVHINFYDGDWKFCFTKQMASGVLGQITGINCDVLNYKIDLPAISVAQKMSWAATRQATRIEDVAYSLLGIFGLNMPMLYGEEERAFLRLQAEIINSCPGPTILAWTHRLGTSENISEDPEDMSEDSGDMSEDSEDISEDPEDSYSGVMASSPLVFRDCVEVQRLSNQPPFDFSMSNRGIQLRAEFWLLPLTENEGSRLILPVCEIMSKTFGIRVRNLGRSCFVRQNAQHLTRIKPRAVDHRLVLEPFLLKEMSPSRTTAEQTQNLILKSRPCVLQVEMAGDMHVYRRWPWQQWDEQDMVFFGSEMPSEDVGWASLKMVALPPYFDFKDPSANATETVDFLFYAFGWASRPGSRSTPHFTVHRMLGGVDDRALEGLNQEAVRDNWNAYWVGNRLLNQGIAQQHFFVAGTSGRRVRLLVCDLHSVEDATVSPNPFWRAEFSGKIVHQDQMPEASSQSWDDINWGSIWNLY